MTDSAEQSVTPRYGQAIVQSAERMGLVLPIELTERLRHAERVPLSWQDELWEAFCSASGDPLAGLRLGLEIQVGHLDSVGMLLVTCDTLGEALEELIEYAPVIGDGGEFQLHRKAEQVYIDYQPHLSVRQPERVEAVMASMLKLTRWATGGRFQPSGIWFAHSPLAPLEDYRQLIDCPLYFNAPCNHLGFPVRQLALSQIQANSALREHLRRLADQTLSALGQHSLSARVQQLVRTHPRWGKERIAEQLELSGRHLNRKLAEEGLSFKSLRESVQQQIACDALQADRRVADIAEQLGFSDENAFVRAFRRWQGVTPARYKAQGVDRD
ncbi:AraC family transcriptional regulator [Halopseudomonas pelagia]|uniref:AraC family transcriptional regulator n=1 Tax=Halopseudomonas pelagia TaxID=553151 RepID=UPI0030DAA3C2|tara:strand:- start:138819 stop:139802 length:984 start_codon:yes stop_codon:yes gene_type:complete